MSTVLIRRSASVTIDGDAYDVKTGSTCKLDAGAVPYATSTIVLPLLEDDTIDWLDPRVSRRMPVAMSANGVARTCDLGLRSRVVDHVAKTVTLSLASDEALLGDYASLTVDKGARAHEASARAVCNYVLGKIGAALQPGTDDAAVTAYWPVTNVIPNPTGQTTAANWAAGSGASGVAGITMSSPLPPIGSRAVTWTAAAGDSNVIPAASPTAYRVTPGKKYVFASYVATGGTPRSARAVIQWWGDSGTVIVASSFGASLISDAITFRRIWVIAEAPPGAQFAYPYINTQGNTAGQSHFAALAMFYEGDEVVPAFLGTTAAGGGYTYAFQGAVHASPSTRTPVVERLPALFTWKPGVTAWDFLLAILTSVGLVLWCDEQRRWHLAAPENRTIATLVGVASGNTREGTDALSRDDSETFVTGVVVRYRWRDEWDDIEREEVDTAGTTQKVLVVELSRPFPGPGAAAAILARRQGTGRRQDVTTITQMGTTPGMATQISLPGAPDTLGRVASVEFDLASGFMVLGAAGLVDIIPGSIAALTGTIDALVGTINSL